MSDVPRPSGEEDARLVRRARDGDREAFEKLVRRHLRAAHRTASRRTDGPHDAEDVCQEAFVRALRKIDECGRPERFRGWLLAIVRNTATNMRERRSRRREESLDAGPAAAAAGGPDRDLERARLRDRLREAMEELPPRQRKVLVRHDYEGWTHREIGDELGIAPGTSRYHLHEARERMKEELSTPRRRQEAAR